MNNKYRERDIEEYKLQFEQLLQKAIGFAANNSKHVFVLSIPDWSITPFAKDRDIEKVATEIDLFNEVCKTITTASCCNFIDITAEQRLNGGNATMLAEDGLHPSAVEYAKWAEKLADAIAARCFA